VTLGLIFSDATRTSSNSRYYPPETATGQIDRAKLREIVTRITRSHIKFGKHMLHSHWQVTQSSSIRLRSRLKSRAIKDLHRKSRFESRVSYWAV